MVRVTIVNGPDAGAQFTFEGEKVRIGRSPRNDLVVRDPAVSAQHAELAWEDGALRFRDLRSRHGSQLMTDGASHVLNDRAAPASVVVAGSARILVGTTILAVTLGDVPPPPAPTGEHILTRSTRSVEQLTQHLAPHDLRLQALLALSRQLNAATDLDAILALIARAAFDAFPATAFVAVAVPDDAPGAPGPMRTLFSRHRDAAATGGAPLLSQSLLRQVHESQESVLYLRDAGGVDPTASMVLAQITSCMAVPLVGQQARLGVLQADTRGTGRQFSADDLDLFAVLASYTAFAIERARLAQSLQLMFEGVVRLSVRAIEARDPTTFGHSERVAEYTLRLARLAHDTGAGPLAAIRFSSRELVQLRYAALLHDFGKIGVQECVLNKGTRLWQDRLAVVRERFATARAGAHADALRAALAEATREGWPVDAVSPRATALAAQRLEVIDAAERLVLEHQDGRRLDDGTAAALRRVAGLHFTDASGVARPLLTADELDDMLIPQGTLNPREWDEMRSHARRSRDFLLQIPWSDELADVPRFAGWHHEKLDGSGYPDGLRGDAIPAAVRMLTIADIFDALTAADRPYRKAASVARTLAILHQEATAGMLDAALVEAFGEGVVPGLVAEGRVAAG